MKIYRVGLSDTKIVCSFCGKSQHEVSKMVSDPKRKVFICDECIEVCRKLASKEPSIAK